MTHNNAQILLKHCGDVYILHVTHVTGHVTAMSPLQKTDLLRGCGISLKGQ